VVLWVKNYKYKQDKKIDFQFLFILNKITIKIKLKILEIVIIDVVGDIGQLMLDVQVQFVIF
jgi:hypothetical protein